MNDTYHHRVKQYGVPFLPTRYGQRTLCKHEEILVVGNTDDTHDASRVS